MSQRVLIYSNNSQNNNSIVVIVCEKCGESINQLEYNDHLKTHKEKKVRTCDICNKTFTNISNFKYHMSHHSEERPWYCDECPKRYKTKVDLIQHMRIHEITKDLTFICEVCDAEFSTRSKYNVHMKTHTVKGPQKCEICNKVLVNLRSHIKEVHEKARIYKCEVCSKEFAKKSGLVRHSMTVHEKLKIWTCEICEKSFGEKAALMKHKKIHLKSNQYNQFLEINEPFIIEEGTIEMEHSNESTGAEGVEEVFIITELESANEEADCDSNQNSKEVQEIEVLDEFREAVMEVPDKYSCNLCSFTFKQNRYLKSHLKTVHGGSNIKMYECNLCSERFLHRSQKLRHMRQKHPEFYEENGSTMKKEANDEEISRRTCELCNKVFVKSKYLELHMSSVHQTVVYECDLCQKTFSFKRSMERHIKAIHEDRRDFKCLEPNCERAFRSRYELNKHFQNIHSKNNKSTEEAVCDICEKVCASKKALYSHKKSVHEGVRWGSDLKCKICLETFDSRYKKIKHMQQVHKNGEVKFRTCQVCMNNFKLYDVFKAHIETHEGYFICVTCGYNFPNESLLFIHQETHKKIEEDLRRFICDICDHRLTTKAQLQIHMRNHSSEEHYVCDECGKSYKFLAPFLHHKLVHENKFDFSCSFCSKTFRKMRDKDLHEKTHSGIRPYKCHVCEKAFALKPNYTNHMKTHQAKYFECKICHVQQSSSTKLRQHEMTEHPQEFPFKCLNCMKVFKTLHTYEDHSEKCYEDLSIEC